MKIKRIIRVVKMIVASMIGYMIGVWVLYAIIASFAKHKISIIITGILGLVGSVSSAIALNSPARLIDTFSVVVAVVLICSVPPLQIKSQAKEEWKEKRKKEKNRNKEK